MPAQELQFEEMAADAPVNLAVVFRRLEANVDLEEDQPESGESAGESDRSGDLAGQRPSASSTAAADEDADEESVDAYMARLMQRIRSAEDESESRSPAASQAKPENPAVGSPVAAPQPQVTPQCELSELPPRAVPPEKRIDLSALRELANLSADAAINQHSRQVLIRTMASKLLVALVALLAGGGLLWMWRLAGAEQLTFYSGLLALLIAIYWGVEYALLTGRLIISKSGSIDWNSSGSGRSRSAAAKRSGGMTPEDTGPATPDDTGLGVDGSSTSDSAG